MCPPYPPLTGLARTSRSGLILHTQSFLDLLKASTGRLMSVVVSILRPPQASARYDPKAIQVRLSLACDCLGISISKSCPEYEEKVTFHMVVPYILAKIAPDSMKHHLEACMPLLLPVPTPCPKPVTQPAWYLRALPCGPLYQPLYHPLVPVHPNAARIPTDLA